MTTQAMKNLKMNLNRLECMIKKFNPIENSVFDSSEIEKIEELFSVMDENIQDFEADLEDNEEFHSHKEYKDKLCEIKNDVCIYKNEFDKKKALFEELKNKNKLKVIKKKETKQTKENIELLMVDSIIDNLKAINKNEDMMNQIRAKKGMKVFETKEKINYDELREGFVTKQEPKKEEIQEKRKCFACILF